MKDLSKVDETELISQQKESTNNYLADRSDFETGRKDQTYGQDTPQLGAKAQAANDSKRSLLMQMMVQSNDEGSDVP